MNRTFAASVVCSLLVSGTAILTAPEAQAAGSYTIRKVCELPVDCIWLKNQCLPANPNIPPERCIYHTTQQQCQGVSTLPGDAPCGLPLVIFNAELP